MIIKKSCFHLISKYMICLLCCLMLFCLISKPLTAHASVAATVTIGAYGVIKVVMSSKVLVGLIVGSFSGFAMSMLVPDMDDWYDSDPVVRNWADQYNGAISGGEVISIPASVQDSIRARYDVNSSINISTLYVPYDLTHLERVSAAHVFGTDVASQLEANNTLLQKVNLLLSDIIGSFDSLSSSFTSALNSISTTFRAEFSQFKTWYQTINENTKIELHQVVNWLSDLNTNLVSELSQLKTWTSSINSTIKSEIKGVKTNIVEIQQVIAREFAGAIGSITSVLEDGFTSVEAKIDSIVASPGAFGPSIDTISGKLDTLLDPVQTWIGSINETLVDSFASLKSAVVSLPDGIISLTDSIKTNVISGFSSVVDWFSKLYTDFKARLDSIVTWMSTINTNVKSELGQLKTWASNINTTIKNEIKGVKTNLVEIQDVLARELAGVASSIRSDLDIFSSAVQSGFSLINNLSGTMVDSFTDLKDWLAYSVSNKLSFINSSIDTGLTNLGTKVKSIIDSCTVAITDSISLVGQKIDVLIDSFADFAQPAPSDPSDGDKHHVIVGGINSGLGYFGQSNGILSKYATGFLAATSIFNLFAEVPFFNDLITISVCIGLVGVLLGIVLSASKSDSQSHSKSRSKTYASNGG